MMPGGMNPKQMKQMMKRLGIKTEEIEATQVIIKCPERTLFIDDPQVILTKMPGQEALQITGEIIERDEVDDEPVEADITEEDVEMVIDQANVGKEQAVEMLEETRGDIAEAIMRLKQEDLTSDAEDL